MIKGPNGVDWEDIEPHIGPVANCQKIEYYTRKGITESSFHPDSHYISCCIADVV